MATFKARARALDMLGRQQIAGIPTAISELFKNAHDAYAEHVQVDFFRSAQLFILRDDGLGMTREDFETRWLTLGTESKVGTNTGMSTPPVDSLKSPRPIMGEKGIGRLAIAAIGPQVLVLTRAKREGSCSDLVAAFIHWGLFEAPGIDLDQIDIPISVFPGGTLPSIVDINNMVSSVRIVVDKLANKIEPDLLRRIISDLDRFGLDISLLLDRCPGPTLIEDGHGTHFYIIPADESIIANLNTQSEDVASNLTKFLIGFANTMTPDHPKPHMVTAFRDYKIDSLADDIIEEKEFWTPQEFWNADHHFVGDVDEYGQFTGTVSVYGEQTNNHLIPWANARGKPTACGPFSVSVAYVHGAARESTLPPLEYAMITSKLNRIGGLYIYKDGIRILPYGNNDVDFLDLEKRRSKGAGYYFFSYRRIFGAVQINQKNNSELSEKAGREGFRENRAYREFKSILENIFIQIAADFFRAEGQRADIYNRRREELKRTDAARKHHHEQTSTRKRAFLSSLESSLNKIQLRILEKDVSSIIERMRRELSEAIHLDPTQYIATLLQIENSTRRRLETLRAEFQLAKPRGVGLSRQGNREWQAYSSELSRLDAEVFKPATRRIDEEIGDISRQTNISIDIRRRVETAITTQADSSMRATRQLDRELRSLSEQTMKQAAIVAQESLTGLDTKINEVIAEFARTDISSLGDDAVVKLRERLLSEIESKTKQKRELLEGVCSQLKSLSWKLDDSGHFIGMNETIEALDEERLELREQAEFDVELIQLGLAVQVINHEFGAAIKSVRDNLKLFKGWVDVNPKLSPIYDGIKNSFEHLGSYLMLFTPLNRRIYQAPVNISGEDIGSFLKDLFHDRLLRHGIKLIQTPEFKQKEIVSYPSTFYPVFVNLLDNAIYWIGNSSGERCITLDADVESFFVKDTGPGIPIQDREAVFEAGFSRKIGGRGLGLFIARDVLKKAGYTLSLENPVSGTTFRIGEANVFDEGDAK